MKIHLASFLYCTVLVSLNWFRSTTRTTAQGIFKEEIQPVELAAILSGVVLVILVIACVCKARLLLERGSKLGRERWIQSYSSLLYALPLLWHQGSSSTSLAADGAKTVVSRGYGNEFSGGVFLSAVVGLLLLQIAMRLWQVEKPPTQGTTDNFGAASLRA